MSSLAEDHQASSFGFGRKHPAFYSASILFLSYLILVIVFGAYVRAGLHGDGCGRSWPHCGNTIVPDGSSVSAIIEFTHRTTSTLSGLIALAFVFWARKIDRKGGYLRKSAMGALVFTVVAGLIGASLVLFEWVTTDKSVGRAITMPLHLINTYFLIASVALMAYFSGGGKSFSFKNQGSIGTGLRWALGGMFVLGMTGALSAMGRTAFSTNMESVNTFMERITLHIGENAPALLKGGATHPLIATSVAVIVIMVVYLVMHRRESPEVKRWGQATVGLFLIQMVFGIINLVVSAPLWMQMTHLTIALADWLCLVMLVAHALKVQEPATTSAPSTESFVTEPRPFKAIVKDYYALTKPRVISLLLFTTLAAMFIGAEGWPGFWLTLAVMIGGYMAAGSANAYNMVIERDLDEIMERTSRRPIVGHRISPKAGLWFASIMGVGSFAILWAAANLLAALMALAGLLCYVFVYTIWLKRRTWQNIVIGGAAGAFPPLVGYAAVTGELNSLAWFLFALILTWTPVHFWALAILIKDDYAAAGFPMLPVIKGDRYTVIQIGIYAVLTAVLCILPLIQGQVGMVYAIGAGLLNLGLILYSYRLFTDTNRQQAKALFKFSMIYLALFFIVVAIDQSVVIG